VQLASHDCLRFADKFIKKKASWWNYLLWRSPIKHDGILFCEDDLSFSNMALQTIQGFQAKPDMSFLTVYQPENGYRLHSNGEIDSRVFYGTQCLILPLTSLRLLSYNDDIRQAKDGYDRVWVNTLGLSGLKPYALDASYVQHTQVASLLAGHTKSHTSQVFKFNLEDI